MVVSVESDYRYLDPRVSKVLKWLFARASTWISVASVPWPLKCPKSVVVVSAVFSAVFEWPLKCLIFSVVFSLTLFEENRCLSQGLSLL